MRRWIAVGVLAVLTLAVAAGAVLTLRASHRDDRAAEDRTQVVAVATKGVDALITLAPGSSAATLKGLEPSLTGSFLSQFKAMFDTFNSVVTKGKVSSKGTIAATAVQSLSASSAKVLIAANASVSAPKHQTTARDYRFRVDLVRSGGAWKISGMGYVS